MIIKRAFTAIGLVAVLMILFFTTDPEHLPAAVLGLVFILLYLVCLLALNAGGLLLKDIGLLKWQQARILRVSGLLAILPVFLLGLQSIGQLTARDLLLSIGLFALLYFYFNRLAAQNNS